MRAWMFYKKHCQKGPDEDNEQPEPNICFLCLEDISLNYWENHRRVYCPKKRLFSTFKTSEARCAKCHGRLRLIPREMWKKFECKNRECHHFPARVVMQSENSGANRYNCFPCDFDMCDECVELEIAHGSRRKSSNSSKSSSSSSSSSSEESYPSS